jgi:K(+)-stimulated pyrophosphate-energized sodium pump
MNYIADMTSMEKAAIWAVFFIAWLGLAYALFLRSQILREDKGTPKMQEVWNAIKDGANAYLTKQLRSILPLIGILTVALFFSVYVVPPSEEAMQRFNGMSEDQVKLIIGFARALAFVMGASFSLLVGQLGMRMAVEGNVRVASASRRSFGDALLTPADADRILGFAVGSIDRLP